jgi:hypothetical protein
MALRLWFSGKPLQRPGGAGASSMREGSAFGAYMTDDFLLYLLGQICELKAGRRSRMGDRVRRHRAKPGEVRSEERSEIGPDTATR